MIEIVEKLLSGERQISTTGLTKGKESTRNLIHYLTEPQEKKGFFDFGNAFELYLIDKDSFYNEVAIFDDREILLEISKSEKPVLKPKATKKYKEVKEKFYSENQSKYIINREGDESFETIKSLAELCEKHPFTPQLKGDYQPAFTWICKETGLKRYSRPDIANKNKGVIIDIKTTANRDFEREASKLDYFLKAWDQMQGAINSGYMAEVKEYYFYVVTKKAPFYVDVYFLNPNEMLRVEESYLEALRRIKTDLDNGGGQVWQKIPTKLLTIPNWYK